MNEYIESQGVLREEIMVGETEMLVQMDRRGIETLKTLGYLK